jgi:NADPH:quinone reductase
MKAIRPIANGGPEVLKLEDVATPAPAAGQILVETEAIGVNFIDVYQRTGLYTTPRPIPLGLEGTGIVTELGPDVDSAKVGDRVVWSGVPGSYATAVLVNADRAVPVPEGVDARVATAAMLQGLTAHYLATDAFPLRQGHVALVHAAAGGTGLLLVQIAKRAGARVIGTVSNAYKAELARAAGADDVIAYTEQDFESETRRLTQGRGVDVVYDSVGATTFQKSLRSLRARGYLVLFGQSSGVVPALDPQVLSANGSLFLTRPTLAHYTQSRAELLGRARDIFAWIQAGILKVRIGHTFPLAEARAAHQALEGRDTAGKVLLIP